VLPLPGLQLSGRILICGEVFLVGEFLRVQVGHEGMPLRFKLSHSLTASDRILSDKDSILT
jgi:hypothetical protein